MRSSPGKRKEEGATRMKANDSLECRNCHGYDYMDFTRQSSRAAFMHSTYLATNEKPVSTATRHRAPAAGCDIYYRR